MGGFLTMFSKKNKKTKVISDEQRRKLAEAATKKTEDQVRKDLAKQDKLFSDLQKESKKYHQHLEHEMVKNLTKSYVDAIKEEIADIKKKGNAKKKHFWGGFDKVDAKQIKQLQDFLRETQGSGLSNSATKNYKNHSYDDRLEYLASIHSSLTGLKQSECLSELRNGFEKDQPVLNAKYDLMDRLHVEVFSSNNPSYEKLKKLANVFSKKQDRAVLMVNRDSTAKGFLGAIHRALAVLKESTGTLYTRTMFHKLHKAGYIGKPVQPPVSPRNR